MKDTILPPIPRSLLFVPATSARKVEKALTSAADGVIVDLEDAVATAEKAQARQFAAGFLAAAQGKTVFLRVNALSTPFCYDDLLVAAAAHIDGIVLPKAESAADIATVDWLLHQLETRAGKQPGSIELTPILETAKGIAAAASVASASPRIRRLAFGAVDLALDMDVDLEDDAGAINQARFALTLASRSAGLEGPLDTVFTDIADLAGLAVSSKRARAMGFSGKACIHPAQIETVNAAFSPSEAELALARTIVTAFDEAEAAGLAAVSVNGVMVDYPVVLKARRTLERSRA
ncbi:CoA ester lyase [Acidisphaera sp. L21]|uniref:HpcH/HpaI aldolase/citrate lyase family protein n=1 Tax=Acidisphaera sp. L21 TaxID=1641851 RepID=UPI00131BCC33|nr:CoA ester lyase [Acidisphaera sp. L21]